MRRWPLTALCFLAAVLAGFTVIRDPDSLGPIVWQQLPVSVVVHEQGSDDVVDGSDIDAVRDAMASWRAPCSSFAFEFGGTHPERVIAQDGLNVVAWLETDWPGGANGAGAFTVRYRNSGSPDTWSETDIRMNGENYEWATDGRPERLDVQAIAAHELGHALGLFHSTVPESTMYYTVTNGLSHSRSLHADDLAGLCFLYPSDGERRCSSDLECPMFLGQYGGTDARSHCAGGRCEPGPAGFGAECFGGSDCTSGLCAEDPTNPPGSEPGFCSEDCASSPASCPAGSFCSAALGPTVCYPGHDDCLVHEDCEPPNGRCVSDLDGRFRCVQLCAEDTDCAMGEVCHPNTGGQGVGSCHLPGTKLGNEPCLSGLECESLLCTQAGAVPTCVSGPSGALPDAGFEDSGLEVDAGSVVEVEVDAGVAPSGPKFDATEDIGASCGCASLRNAKARPLGLGWMLVLGLLALRRRPARTAK